MDNSAVYQDSRAQLTEISVNRSFKVKEFEGPLDLLLFLVKKNEINIYDIPIAQITEQYLAYLKYATDLDLEDLTEFHALAAALLYIKSRMLLPVEIDLDDFNDPRQELVETLIEYQKFKKLTGLMEERSRETEWVIERKKLQWPLPFNDDELWEEIDVWELVKTFAGLMNSIQGEQKIIDLFEEVSINEKITLLSELMETRGICNFTDLITGRGSLMDKICAFLALLEAIRSKMVTVYQNRMFGDIQIRSRNNQQEGENGGKTES
ncbi:MAG: segregation/condensation protein A [Treponema sp.]|jgi:segregation and condensation protein A|nr:segregation/condensation protein A [Treponema sp.]